MVWRLRTCCSHSTCIQKSTIEDCPGWDRCLPSQVSKRWLSVRNSSRFWGQLAVPKDSSNELLSPMLRTRRYTHVPVPIIQPVFVHTSIASVAQAYLQGGARVRQLAGWKRIAGRRGLREREECAYKERRAGSHDDRDAIFTRYSNKKFIYFIKYLFTF